MKKIILVSFLLVLSSLSLLAQTANAPESTLESPYNTMYVHLHYLQPETYRPDLAAVTLFRTKDSLSRINDAIKLKQIFDGNGLYVRLNQLPQEANYIDTISKKSYYTPFPEELPDIYLEKIEDQWLYSQETVSLIPALHKATYPLGTDRLLTLLPKMGHAKFLGLATWQYLTIIIILLFGWLFYKALSGILMPVVKQILSSYLRSDLLENAKVLQVAQAISLLFLFWIIRVLVPVLQLPIEVAGVIILMIRIILTLVGMILAIRLVRLAMDYAMRFAEGTEHRMDEQLIPIIRRSLMILFVLIAVFHILQLLEVNVAALIAGVSIGGLALALAAQDTVKNLIGSAMIFFDRPFQIGDYIVGGGVEGTVKEVGFRTTRIQTMDTSIIAVPNGTIANVAITNLGVRVYRVLNTTLTITYDTPPDVIEKFIKGLKEMILQHPLTKKEDYYVHFTALDASSLNILFRSYLEVNSYAEELQVKENLLLGILRLASALEIDFAFPSSSIYVNTAAKENESMSDADQRIQNFIDDFQKRNPTVTEN